MMAAVQEILVYITLGLALLFLVRKYFWPKRLISGKKIDKGCEHQDCECN